MNDKSYQASVIFHEFPRYAIDVGPICVHLINDFAHGRTTQTLCVSMCVSVCVVLVVNWNRKVITIT